MRRFKIGNGQVLLLGSVPGLVAERVRVLAALNEIHPDVLAIGVSPESAAALLRYEPSPDVDPFEDIPDHDYIYSVKLREFGEVELPAPDLVAAIRWARDANVPFFGVDLPEERYEDVFTKEVSAWGFLRYGRIQRKLAKKPPKAADARAFSLAWDARIRKVKGIARVEAARELAMAEQAAGLARDKAAKVLLLVEAAREAGISERLSGME